MSKIYWKRIGNSEKIKTNSGDDDDDDDDDPGRDRVDDSADAEPRDDGDDAVKVDAKGVLWREPEL